MPVLVKTKRKVLFLDIDGVCNSMQFAMKNPKGGILGIDMYCALLVGRIQLQTGCEVVLSSTWRLNPQSRQEVRDQVLDFIDVTPDLMGRPRGEEIQQWLDANPVDVYAILDDDADMLVSQAPNFFKTSWDEGLTEEIADAVIDHLNGEKRTRCAACEKPIHIDHFAGVKKGEKGEEFYCDALPCLMQLSKETV